MEAIIITVATLLLSFATSKIVAPRREQPLCEVDLINVSIFDNLGTDRTINPYEGLTVNQKSALHILQEKKDIQLFNAFVHSVNMSDREIAEVKEILTLKSI